MTTAVQNFVLPRAHLPAVHDGINIILVGTGGTGGYIIQDLLKTIGALRDDIKERMFFLAIDDDIVEPKNIGRQLFVPQDIGKPKAQVLVERYSGAFGLTDQQSKYCIAKLTTVEQLHSFMADAWTNVIISAVDRNAPRNIIYKGVTQWCDERKFAYVYTIDCGNGESNGQVCIGANIVENSQQIEAPAGEAKFGEEPSVFSIPSPYTVFPNLLDLEADRREDEMSCAERAVANVQSMLANRNAANMALNYVCGSLIQQFQNQVTARPDCPITRGVVSFDAYTNGFSDRKLTADYLALKGY